MIHAVTVACVMFAGLLVLALVVTGVHWLTAGPVDELLAGRDDDVSDLDADWGWPE